MLYQDIVNRNEKIAVIGLGYVGMPVAIAFARRVDVIGFDLNTAKIAKYRQGLDPTNELGDAVIGSSTVEFTDDEKDLQRAKFHIIAVPTPVRLDKTPDLSPVIAASEIVGRNMVVGSIVVYESTVYPGVTEDICVPILERVSGLKCGVDFKVGYSPERINPGDKIHRLENIVKIVSGMDDQSLEEIAQLYSLIITAGVHRAPSIKVAEAAKVVENSQRDINIAFVNELAMVFDKMGIDTNDVIDAMNTKWNALNFRAGLVGGHCIGVDPYYFIYEAGKLGYHSQIILSGRRVNDGMGQFVADAVIKKMAINGKTLNSSKVAILGITFKENCQDVRNSKVVDIVNRLKEYGIKPIVSDCYADRSETKSEYDIDLVDMDDIRDLDCLILAVAHDQYKNINLDKLTQLFRIDIPNKEKIVADIKGILDKEELLRRGYTIWRL